MNKCIECQNIIFDILSSFVKRKEKLPSCLEIRKMFTNIKKEKDTETIKNRKGLTKKQQRKKCGNSEKRILSGGIYKWI